MGLNAASSYGTIVARQDAGVGSFTDIGELRDITPPALTHNSTDVTAQGDNDEHFVVGVRRTGEFTFSIFFDPDGATHDHTTGLISSWSDSQKDGWRITYPNSETLIFSGYITNIAIQAPLEGALTADVTVRPTAAKAFS